VVGSIAAISGRRPAFIEGNVCDGATLDALFGNYSIEAVIHFAAFKAVGESVERPLAYYDNNVGGLSSLLGAMQRHGVRRIVFSSSCTVYGEPDRSPVTETTPRKEAASPYGNTKRICEDILRDVAATGTIEAIALRYFNPIGAHPSAHIGELPLGVPNNLVPYITQTAIGKRQQLTVHGNDYPTPDGTCIRDYIHVVDLAEAHVAAMGRVTQGRMEAGYEVYNVGTGKGNSVMEAIVAFEHVSGKSLNYRIGPRREGDITAIWAETALAEEKLGWKSRLTMSDAMRDAWNWEKAIG
jgi:UDP-glucose 4-epimerase